jgi:YVTN family beta-propeller protein
VATLLGASALSSWSLGAISASPLAVPRALRTSGEPFGIAIDAASGRAYATDSKENTLFVLDAASGNPLAYIPTGRQPNHIVLSGARAFVSNFADASITVIDTSTNRPLKTLSVGGLGLAIDRETNRLYAAGGSRVFVLDTTTDALIATLAAPAGANVWGVAVDPATNRIYATDIAAARVLVYDGATNALVAQVAIDAPARFGIAVGASTRVFVASYTDKSPQLSIIDGASAKVIARAPVGSFTTSLLVDPVSNLVYASSGADRTVTAINPATRAAPSKVSLTQTPGGLALSPTTGEVVVVTPGGAPPPARTFVDATPAIRP